MPVNSKLYGVCGGKDITEYVLENANGMKVSVLDRGAIIKNIILADKNGKDTDVVLGHKNAQVYESNPGYFGAAIGRCANRLKHGEFHINGVKYKSGINDGENSLHGGIIGFDKKMWNADVLSNSTEPSVTFSLKSLDGEEGYPGNLDIKVTYSLSNDNTLSIHYEGVSDKDTVLNMTNHSYFNLGGHNSGSIDKHTIKMQSSFFTPNNSECMPYGEILSVEGRVFDLRNGKTFGEVFASNDEQVKMFGGFDHNFVLDGYGMREFAVISCEETGISMHCYTDLPGVQIYTANMLEEKDMGKDGVSYTHHAAVCAETQCFPNAMECTHFPDIVLKSGEKYDTTTKYRFSVGVKG